MRRSRSRSGRLDGKGYSIGRSSVGGSGSRVLWVAMMALGYPYQSASDSRRVGRSTKNSRHFILLSMSAGRMDINGSNTPDLARSSRSF